MTILSSARLREELHCLTHDGKIVITAQRWTDPAAPEDRPRSWLRLVRNGRQRQVSRFTGAGAHAELDAFWAGLAERYEPTALTEDQMWVRLKEITGTIQSECARAGCEGRMPVAWEVCPECGRNARRVAGGAMTANRRRLPDIMVPAGAFARSNDAS